MTKILGGDSFILNKKKDHEINRKSPLHREGATNTIILKLFPFLLKDKAKTWLQNLRSGSIRAWDEMQQQFLKKCFPSHGTNSFKRQITTFTQKPGETFYQCWDRY